MPKSLHIILSAFELEVGLLIEPLGSLVPLVCLEVYAVRLGLKAVQHTDGNIQVCNFLSLQSAEVCKQNASNAAMANKQAVVFHTFELDNHRTQAVDDVQVALSTGAGVAIV
jgi:ABC-type transport system involved in cytochrome bd biosynthesis fused ATPase/permease subunit